MHRLNPNFSAGYSLANYWKRTGLAGVWLVSVVLVVAALFIFAGVSELEFRRQTAAEHLQLALAACGMSVVSDSAGCKVPTEARRQLAGIPEGAKEYAQATTLENSIKSHEAQQMSAHPKQSDATRQSEYPRYLANMAGTVHDPFQCASSTENKPIVSFDGGGQWWKDDGRCAEQLQRAKNSDAEMSSYVPTTLRVDTDIDSSWLPNEERKCQTYPDDKGKVSSFACSETGNHRGHNIPVRFWGGVQRDNISDWTCRRETGLLGDGFVCRAID